MERGCDLGAGKETLVGLGTSLPGAEERKKTSTVPGGKKKKKKK